LLRIDEEAYGPIQNFSFSVTAPLGDALQSIITSDGEDLS
jgi:hypothetical protein